MKTFETEKFIVSSLDYGEKLSCEALLEMSEDVLPWKLLVGNPTGLLLVMGCTLVKLLSSRNLKTGVCRLVCVFQRGKEKSTFGINGPTGALSEEELVTAFARAVKLMTQLGVVDLQITDFSECKTLEEVLEKMGVPRQVLTANSN